MEREPVRAGSFYPADPDMLTRAIEEAFTGPLGPGTIPAGTGCKRAVKGAVVPHAGYAYSGAVAAWVYSRLMDDGLPETFVIAGPNHTGLGKPVSVYPSGHWRTPLGSMEIDAELAEAVIAAGGGSADFTGHLQEHSIEVQLPFLQFIANDSRIMPVCLNSQTIHQARALGEAVARAAVELQRDIVFLASSDFTHAGLWYMQAPPAGQRVDQFAKQQDKKVIDRIMDLEPGELLSTVDRHNISMCGHGCISAMLVYAAMAGAGQAELLKYATSYDVSPADAAVGYAALLVT
ncbi:MAG: AmmeMemoRadiSam system protein B [Gemmatimonadota bacterium]|nr:AmmeMemoRadiSam system protein B [Gemmatimonadota bacterium]